MPPVEPTRVHAVCAGEACEARGIACRASWRRLESPLCRRREARAEGSEREGVVSAIVVCREDEGAGVAVQACLWSIASDGAPRPAACSSAPNGVEDADAHPIEWVRALEGEVVEGRADVVDVDQQRRLGRRGGVRRWRG